MGDTFTDVMSSMTELGIDPNSLDVDSEPEAEAIDTEVESEAKEEVVEAGAEEGQAEDSATPEGEEKLESPAPVDEVKEGPKLTAKEFQEIEAAKAALEVEKQSFQEERVKLEKEFQEKYHEKVKTHDQFDDFLGNLAAKDPELFEVIKAEFQEHQKQYSNPVLEQIRQETQSLRQELNSFKNKASDEVTLTKLDSELAKFNSTLGKEAEAAGIKVDRKVLEDFWAKGLTVEEAFHAKYGPAFAKAQVSKTKVATAEKKVAARPAVTTAGSIKRSNAPVSEPKGLSTDGWVAHFAKQFAGKA